MSEFKGTPGPWMAKAANAFGTEYVGDIVDFCAGSGANVLAVEKEADLRRTVLGFAMAVFMRKVFSKPLLQNQCYKQ